MLRRAISGDDPPDEMSHMTSGLIKTLEKLIEAGDIAEANVVAAAIPTPTDADSLWRLARVFDLHLGQRQQAEPLYRAAIPESLDAIVDLTLMLDEQGRDEAADHELRVLAPEVESTARVLRGRHYRAHNSVERALEEYRRGVALGDVTALRYLAGTLSFLGRHASAEQLYRHAPLGFDADLSLDHVDFLRDLGRRDDAEALLIDLIQQDIVMAHRVLGDLISELAGREDEAVEHYLTAITRGDVRAITNLGVEWRDQNRRAEAEYALGVACRDGDELACEALHGLAYGNDTSCAWPALGSPARRSDKWASYIDELRSRSDLSRWRYAPATTSLCCKPPSWHTSWAAIDLT